MEYRDFVEQVKEQIQDFLPEKFSDAANAAAMAAAQGGGMY